MKDQRQPYAEAIKRRSRACNTVVQRQPGEKSGVELAVAKTLDSKHKLVARGSLPAQNSIMSFRRALPVNQLTPSGDSRRHTDATDASGHAFRWKTRCTHRCPHAI